MLLQNKEKTQQFQQSIEKITERTTYKIHRSCWRVWRPVISSDKYAAQPPGYYTRSHAKGRWQYVADSRS